MTAKQPNSEYSEDILPSHPAGVGLKLSDVAVFSSHTFVAAGLEGSDASTKSKQAVVSNAVRLFSPHNMVSFLATHSGDRIYPNRKLRRLGSVPSV